MRDLFLIGMMPCALFAGLGSWAVPVVLGDDWARSGVIVAWLSAGTLAQFTASPFSQLLNIAGHSRWLLSWDITRLVAVTAAFTVPVLAGGGLLTAIAAYSATSVVLYTALGRMCLAAIRNPR